MSRARVRTAAAAAGAVLLAAGPSLAVARIPPLPVLASGTTERITLRLDGRQAIGDPYPYVEHVGEPSVSADGRYAVFTTGLDLGFRHCPNPPGNGRGNGGNHVYLRDLVTGRLEHVSVSARGCLADGAGVHTYTSVSADGRYVAFSSPSQHLVTGLKFPPGTYQPTQIYVRDRLLRRTRIATLGLGGDPGNYDSEYPAVSDDGRHVVFRSRATNLVPGDGGNPNDRLPDVYLRDMQLGRTVRVGPKLRADQGKWSASISGNGRYVVFTADAPNFAPHLGSGSIIYQAGGQAYVYDRITRKIELVSRDDAGHAADNIVSLGEVTSRKISRDGRWIVFHSDATNLAGSPFPTGVLLGSLGRQVYLHDRIAKRTILVSAGPGGVPGNHLSEEACISPDGRWVAFRSYASNLGDVDLSPPAWPTTANIGSDIYLFGRDTRTHRLVTRSTEGVQADRDSLGSCPSDGGKVVVFASQATTLVADDTNTKPDVFTHRY